MTSNAERVAEYRQRSDGGWGASEATGDKWVSSVTITDREIWVNGVKLPFFLREEGPTVEWDEPQEGQKFRVGTVMLPLFITDDDTIVTDLRSQTLADEKMSGERVGMPAVPNAKVMEERREELATRRRIKDAARFALNFGIGA